MKPFSSAVWGMGTTLVYLLDDRIEVGVLGSGYAEELRRVAYRDAVAVTTWRTRRPRMLFLGWTFLALGLAFVAVLAAAFGWSAGYLVVDGVMAIAGAAFLYAGRDGVALQFRVDGTRGSVSGVVVGGRAKQQRFVKELLARIEERRSR